MRCRMRRRSVSSFVSPGPRVPMPPPSRDSAARCRRRAAAAGTAAAPAPPAACPPACARARAKMSRISCVRSMTLRPTPLLDLPQLRRRQLVVEDRRVDVGLVAGGGQRLELAARRGRWRDPAARAPAARAARRRRRPRRPGRPARRANARRRARRIGPVISPTSAARSRRSRAVVAAVIDAPAAARITRPTRSRRPARGPARRPARPRSSTAGRRASAGVEQHVRPAPSEAVGRRRAVAAAAGCPTGSRWWRSRPADTPRTAPRATRVSRHPDRHRPACRQSPRGASVAGASAAPASAGRARSGRPGGARAATDAPRRRSHLLDVRRHRAAAASRRARA